VALDRRHIFESREALAATLADDVAARLAQAIAKRGRATLAVSGGATPKRFLTALSRRELAWDKVTVTLVDERFVPETDERSNQRLIAEHLLQGKAARARFLPLHNDAATPEEAAEHASATIATLPLPLDVAILGMGLDGHTASFFPEGDRLDEALSGDAGKSVLPMRAPDAGEPRLTLSFAVLAEAQLLALHIEGAEKMAVLEKAEQDGPEEEMPIRAVLRRAKTPVALYWAA
jgi:6-phosphogluconolactonase